MGWITFAVVVLIVIVIAIVIALVKKAASTPEKKLPMATYRYAMKNPLSQPEQILYHRLREALPECEVLPQVTFSRFLETTPNPPNLKRAAFQKISQKSADYLICLKDFTIVASVELDDSSHDKKRDADRDAILASAGIKVLRWHVSDMPSLETIRVAFTTS